MSFFLFFFFFFNDTATTEIYTLSLHDALPILNTFVVGLRTKTAVGADAPTAVFVRKDRKSTRLKLQSPDHLVCRLLLEKKKLIKTPDAPNLADLSDITGVDNYSID